MGRRLAKFWLSSYDENASHAITEIKDEMGATLIDPLEINQCFHRFYSKLYTSESSDDDSVVDSFFFLAALLSPRLMLTLLPP